ncbi:YmzC family protein [Bacillus safensis]|uniref:YmzC family protein n=1 Tax=Bacillus safensis TaxID=561879 RepID=UPI00203B6723|nr:YmzC family protein [Bacillus safensis]MCM3138131.1 YmzC family protein [Bacillus safensis]
MENAQLELRRIRVILLLIGIVVLFGSCAISNIETRQESWNNHSHENADGVLPSSAALKNNHFAVVKDDQVHVYRFDEKEGELTLVTTKYIDEWDDEEYDDGLDDEE